MKWSWRKAFGRIDPPLNYGDLAPGIVKPSYALAGMVAAHILKNADEVTGDTLVLSNEEKNKYLPPSSLKRKASFKDAKITVNGEIHYHDYDYVGDNRHREYFNSCYVYFKENRYDFDADDKKLIVEAMKKASSLKEERRKAKELEKKQLEACDLIQELFGPPIEEPNSAEPAPLPAPEKCQFSCCNPVKKARSKSRAKAPLPFLDSEDDEPFLVEETNSAEPAPLLQSNSLREPVREFENTVFELVKKTFTN
jgi:hypothetical protein